MSTQQHLQTKRTFLTIDLTLSYKTIANSADNSKEMWMVSKPFVKVRFHEQKRGDTLYKIPSLTIRHHILTRYFPYFHSKIFGNSCFRLEITFTEC